MKPHEWGTRHPAAVEPHEWGTRHPAAVEPHEWGTRLRWNFWKCDNELQMKVLVRLAALAAFGTMMAGCKRVAPATPLDQLNAQQMDGHAVFQTRCATCHADRTDAKLHGPPMLGVFKKPYLPSGAPANDDRVTDTVMHGHGLMPAMGNTIDQQDMDDLLAYLHTL